MIEAHYNQEIALTFSSSRNDVKPERQQSNLCAALHTLFYKPKITWETMVYITDTLRLSDHDILVLFDVLGFKDFATSVSQYAAKRSQFNTYCANTLQCVETPHGVCFNIEKIIECMLQQEQNIVASIPDEVHFKLSCDGSDGY